MPFFFSRKNFTKFAKRHHRMTAFKNAHKQRIEIITSLDNVGRDESNNKDRRIDRKKDDKFRVLPTN